ncbi:serine/threonine-protein kinase AFC1 [Actinidia rufa]|uniref:Serine/threonine-protein kinase AFC1 n=1 Tax=Actinidia rufa TaxID=165716 RepID=A0A7J0HDZ5_9ERIC|nr:serine/threonine-protein kinase AFC1 [Actinidia rufa]
MHDMHLIHTDLKPENILFISPDYVKVPDYKLTNIKITTILFSTRHYRAPEVILGLGWSYPCDIWSVGCILVELCSGEALFQTHENLEHLAMMERVLGPIPHHMLKRVDQHAEKYVRRGRLDWPEGATSRESIKAVLKLHRLQVVANLVMHHVDHSAGDLIDLLQGLLRYDPSLRITAHQALRHPFFTRDFHRRY